MYVCGAGGEEGNGVGCGEEEEEGEGCVWCGEWAGGVGVGWGGVGSPCVCGGGGGGSDGAVTTRCFSMTPHACKLIRGCQTPRETTPGRLRHPAPVLMTGDPGPVPVYRAPKTKELRLWRLHGLCA